MAKVVTEEVKEIIEPVTEGVTTTVAEAKQSLAEAKEAEKIARTAEMVETAKKNSHVLNAYRVEGHGDDAHVYERIILNEQYAGMKGVKEFVMPNGKITYYTEKLVKKYSQNVVKS